MADIRIHRSTTYGVKNARTRAAQCAHAIRLCPILSSLLSFDQPLHFVIMLRAAAAAALAAVGLA
jgi:hypothetical protein